MIAIITGTPGTGKSAIAREVSKALKIPLINERDFCLEKKIGKVERKSKELEVPLEKLQKALLKEVKNRKSLILEGHLLCELKLPADLIVLLHCSSKVLEERLWEKGYDTLKILDNVFCEETKYCSKKVLENFPKNKVLELDNGKSIKEIAERIITEIKKLQKA